MKLQTVLAKQLDAMTAFHLLHARGCGVVCDVVAGQSTVVLRCAVCKVELQLPSWEEAAASISAATIE
jgi:hypothetical protein